MKSTKRMLAVAVASAILITACTSPIIVQPTEVIVVHEPTPYTPTQGDILAARAASEAKEKAAAPEYDRCRPRAQADWRKLLVEAREQDTTPKLTVPEFVLDVCAVDKRIGAGLQDMCLPDACCQHPTDVGNPAPGSSYEETRRTHAHLLHHDG